MTLQFYNQTTAQLVTRAKQLRLLIDTMGHHAPDTTRRELATVDAEIARRNDAIAAEEAAKAARLWPQDEPISEPIEEVSDVNEQT